MKKKETFLKGYGCIMFISISLMFVLYAISIAFMSFYNNNFSFIALIIAIIIVMFFITVFFFIPVYFDKEDFAYFDKDDPISKLGLTGKFVLFIALGAFALLLFAPIHSVKNDDYLFLKNSKFVEEVKGLYLFEKVGIKNLDIDFKEKIEDEVVYKIPIFFHSKRKGMFTSKDYEDHEASENPDKPLYTKYKYSDISFLFKISLSKEYVLQNQSMTLVGAKKSGVKLVEIFMKLIANFNDEEVKNTLNDSDIVLFIRNESKEKCYNCFNDVKKINIKITNIYEN